MTEIISEVIAALPNLDAMDATEMPQAKIDLKRLSGLLMELARYADAKGTAMQFRLAGDIAMAKKLEDHCETIYQRIPQDFRPW